MMRIKEILELEHLNRCNIIIFKEGMFWKAYERSAYLFVNNIKSFHTSKKYIKNVGQDVVSLGFPTSSLDTLLGGLSKESQSEKKAIFLTTWSVLDDDFHFWKESIPLRVSKEPIKEKSSTQPLTAPLPSSVSPEETTLKEHILSFRIENRTPLECMIFLSNLTKELSN